MAAILVMWPGPFEQTFVPLSHAGSMWNLTLIGQAVSEEKMFKECGRRTTDRWTTDGGLVYSIRSLVSLRLRWAKKARLHTLVWDGVGCWDWIFFVYRRNAGECWDCDFLNVAVDKVWDKVTSLRCYYVVLTLRFGHENVANNVVSVFSRKVFLMCTQRCQTTFRITFSQPSCNIFWKY